MLSDISTVVSAASCDSTVIAVASPHDIAKVEMASCDSAVVPKAYHDSSLVSTASDAPATRAAAVSCGHQQVLAGCQWRTT